MSEVVNIYIEGTWTWVKMSEKPNDQQIEYLKSNTYGASFKRSRMEWAMVGKVLTEKQQSTFTSKYNSLADKPKPTPKAENKPTPKAENKPTPKSKYTQSQIETLREVLSQAKIIQLRIERILAQEEAV